MDRNSNININRESIIWCRTNFFTVIRGLNPVLRLQISEINAWEHDINHIMDGGLMIIDGISMILHQEHFDEGILHVVRGLTVAVPSLSICVRRARDYIAHF